MRWFATSRFPSLPKEVLWAPKISPLPPNDDRLASPSTPSPKYYDTRQRYRIITVTLGKPALAAYAPGRRQSPMNSAILHHSFDYTVSGEADCEQTFASGSHPPPPNFESSGASAGQQHTSFAPVISGQRPVNGSMSSAGVHSLSLQGAAAFDYRAPSSSQSADIPFSSGTDLSINSLPSSRGSSSASPNSLGSNYALVPHHQGQYGLGQNVPYNLVSHSSGSGALYSSRTNLPQNLMQSPLDLRSRLTPMPTATNMPPPPTHSIPASPPGIRNDYAVTGQRLSRQGYSSQSSSVYQLSPSHSDMSIIPRSLESSHELPAASVYFPPPNDHALPGSSHNAPPFEGTKIFYQMNDIHGRRVKPEIYAKIEKGFFKVDEQWVCYRRNYFTVLCTFDFLPSNAVAEPMYVVRGNHQVSQVHSFSLCISATADSEDGKVIELVQHTPKRDKGPMKSPERKEVKPNPGGSMSTNFQGGNAAYPVSAQGHDFDGNSPPAVESSTVASFERMQFKKATANNGKRRAAQQYFFLIVELYGKIFDNQGNEEWIKVAHRVSSKMVVRGRSPGHYQDERRASTQTGGGSGHMGYDGGHGHYGGGPMDASMGPHTGMPGLSRNSTFPGGNPAPSRSYLSGYPSSALNGMGVRGYPTNDYMDVDRSSDDPSFYHDEFGGLPSPPTPRAQQLSRQSMNNSPNSLHSGPFNGYLTPLSMKEELRIPSIKVDEDRSMLKLLGPNSSFSSPWMTHEPPRDCRAMAPDAHRSFHHETSAL